MLHTKVCKKCNRIKSLSEFVKDSGSKDGLWSWCKYCQKKQRVKWAKANIKSNPWYNSYNNAKQRCENPKNPNYPWYGAKGIEFRLTKKEVSKLWERDKAYLMEFPTIDRKNNKEHYTFDNCQFLENIDNSIKDNVGHWMKDKYIKYYKIGQYSLDGKLIKIWNSQGQVSRELNIQQSDISRVVNNIHKTCHGFIFKKVEK